MDDVQIERRLELAAEICKGVGVRFTGLRREILSLILAAKGPVGAYDLLDRFKETHKKAAPPTVYRALEFLRAQGLIHRIELRNAFIACVNGGDHRHPVQFLICGHCGSVDKLQDPKIVAAIECTALRNGFQPGLVTVEIEGVCRQCQMKAWAAPSS